MKKILAITSFMLMGTIFSLAAPIDLDVSIDDYTPASPGGNRGPDFIPSIDLSNGVLTFQQNHPVYTLELLDEDGVVVYSVAVPSNQTTIILPSWLSGEYEIRLYPADSNIYFYGWIEL